MLPPYLIAASFETMASWQEAGCGSLYNSPQVHNTRDGTLQGPRLMASITFAIDFPCHHDAINAQRTN